MRCPHCNETISAVACQSCSKGIPDQSLFSCWCGVPVKKEEPVDLSERVPCSDGACIGTINEKGVCSICGKSYAGKLV